MQWSRGEWSGWGQWPRVGAFSSAALDRDSVARAIADAKAGHCELDTKPMCTHLLARGEGRSYGDVATPLDGARLLLTRGMSAIHDFDPETGRLVCGAGATVADLMFAFLPKGWFLPVVPGTKFVTMAGAVANDIHGKNQPADGNFSVFVDALEIMTSAGDVVHCSREVESDLFFATIGGLGLTGVILTVKMRLIRVPSIWMDTETLQFQDLDSFFETDAMSHDFTHNVSWIDCVKTGSAMGRGVFLRGRYSAAPRGGAADGGSATAHRGFDAPPVRGQKLMIPFHAPSCALNRFTVRAFNAWWFHRHPVAPRARQMHIDKFFFPLDGVANWNRMYGRRGFLQYQLVVPPDPERRAIRKLLETITNSGMASFLAVIKEFGQDGQGMLSFARPGTTLALDFTNHGERLLELLKQLDRIVLDAGGAVNLSKDARLSAADFREMYPRFSEWRAVRDKWDPCGLFASSMSRRLGLI